MHVGVARIVLRVPGSRSLKDKRRVVRSFKDKLRAALPVSVAEVGYLDEHRAAIVALTVVSCDSALCHRQVELAARMAQQLPEAELASVHYEVVAYGEGGASLADTGEALEFSEQPEVGPLPWGDSSPRDLDKP
jgi:uncharacterized protein YlxP (DUF503 family)